MNRFFDGLSGQDGGVLLVALLLLVVIVGIVVAFIVRAWWTGPVVRAIDRLALDDSAKAVVGAAMLFLQAQPEETDEMRGRLARAVGRYARERDGR